MDMNEYSFTDWHTSPELRKRPWICSGWQEMQIKTMQLFSFFFCFTKRHAGAFQLTEEFNIRFPEFGVTEVHEGWWTKNVQWSNGLVGVGNRKCPCSCWIITQQIPTIPLERLHAGISSTSTAWSEHKITLSRRSSSNANRLRCLCAF